MKKTKIKIGIDEAGRGPWAGPVVAAALAWNPNNMPEKDILRAVGDSKKLSETKREELYQKIVALSLGIPSSQPSPYNTSTCPKGSLRSNSFPSQGKEAAASSLLAGENGERCPVEKGFPLLFFGIGVVDNFYIDEHGIKQANKEAMRRALLEIKRKIPKDFENLSVVIDGKDHYEFEELSQKPLYIVGGDAKVSEISAASILAKVFRDKIMTQYASLYPEFGFESNSGYGTQKHKNTLQNTSDITGIHRQSYAPVKKVLEHKEKVLVHICCGPDATVPLMDLKKDYEVIAYWYDPNIQPVAEYEKRFDAFVKVCEIEGVAYIRGEYDVKNFFKKIKGLEHTPERGEKCRECYDMRLKRTAMLARYMGIQKWTSSLNNSPHKDMEKMFRLGEKWDTIQNLTLTLSCEEREQAAEILGMRIKELDEIFTQKSRELTQSGIRSLSKDKGAAELQKNLEFLKIAFRKNGGFQRSVDYTNKHNIFRQNYCGCVYSDTFPGSPRAKHAKGGFSG